MNKIKTFLGNAPWREKGRIGMRAGARWPATLPVKKGEKTPHYRPFPFFLAYATAVLEKENKEVLLVDAVTSGLDIEEFIQKIKESNSNLVVLETSTPSINNDLNIANKIKQETNALIALCGPHATTFSNQLLKENDFLDFIFIGEYEFILKNLVNALEKNTHLKEVKGLVFRENNEIINTGRPLLLMDINKLPWPARHLLPMEKYSDCFIELPEPSLQMWASRGCPYSCIYCVGPPVIYGGHTYRVRDPKDVVDEVEAMVKEYDFKSFFFDDDTFDIGKERILKICEEIKKRNLNLPWIAMARVDTCDYEMLKAMKDAGLFAIKFGVESGNQQLVDNAHKNLDLKKVKDTVAIVKQLGIKVHLTFMFGLPGETKETVEQTIKFALELDPDSVQFSITTPFPGTDYYKMLNEKGYILTKDWSDYDGAKSAVMRTEHMTKKDLEEALNKANKIWKRHRLMKNLKQWKYIKRGLFHPFFGIKRVIEELK